MSDRAIGYGIWWRFLANAVPEDSLSESAPKVLAFEFLKFRIFSLILTKM